LLPASKRPFDVVGVIDGMFIAIEFKSEHGKLSPHQLESLLFLAQRGVNAFVVYPKHVEKVYDQGSRLVFCDTVNFAAKLKNTFV
jgi:Holliday junction resolvase